MKEPKTHKRTSTNDSNLSAGIRQTSSNLQIINASGMISTANGVPLDGTLGHSGHRSSLIGPDGKIRLRAAARVFKPYQGDLFSAFDHSGGMLYLSRVHYGTSSPQRLVQAEQERRKTTFAAEETRKTTLAWRNPHSLDRKRRFASSLSTLAGRAEKRISIVKEGAIPVLLKLAGLRDRQISTSCSLAFYNLALEAELRPQIIDAGAVPIIIELMGCGVKKIQRDCAYTLCNLSVHAGYEARLVQDGIIPCLLSLGSVSASLMQVAILTLQNLTCVPERYFRIEELDDVALQYITYSLTYEMELVLLKCLCNLTGLKGGTQTRMIEEGIIEAMHAISKTTTLEGKVLCAKVIANLSTCVRSRNKMVDHKVISAILDFLKIDSPAIENQCAVTVTRLAAEPGCREKLLQYGAIKVILEMSLRPNLALESCRACAAALKAFCADKVLAKRVVKGGGVRALINLIKSSGDQLTRQEATRGLCSLFHYEDAVPHLIDEGAVPAVVGMANGKDVVCASYCASAFYVLSWHSACSASVMDTSVICALNDLCESEHVETRKRCVATLWSLTQNKGKSEDPAVSIPALLKLLRRETDGDMTRLCAAALCNLAMEQKNIQTMLDEGAVAPIIGLCLNDNTFTKIQCGAILCRLSNEPKNRADLITSDYIRTLLSLARVEDKPTQQRSVISLVHMSREPRGRQLLLKHDASLAMVRLSNKPDELIRRGCAAVLCNLAYEVGSEQVMVESGAVSCLLIIALVATDNEETKTTCANGVFNLLHDTATHQSVIEDGAIWGFATLSKATTLPEVNRVCATALCNLSCEFPCEVLSTSSFKAILHLMELSNQPEIQLLATQALANVLCKTANKINLDARQIKLKPTAVPCLKRTIRSPVAEIAMLSSKCLTYVSATEAGRAALIDEGVISSSTIDDDVIASSPEFIRDHVLVIANLCTNADSRYRALAAGCLSRLIYLSTLSPYEMDDVIATCAIRSLYSLSCDPSHLESLIKENALKALSSFVQAFPLTGFTKELRSLASGFVFNLTTCDSLLADLVLQGVVKFMRDYLWNDGGDFPEIQQQCALACCHLGCGHVNSSRVVQEGIATMLIHLAKPNDDGEISQRCAVALRNLIKVNGNHERLVQNGVVAAIVNLFRADELITKQQCAAALRQLTHNFTFRRLLVESGAIDVIIEDSKMQDDEDDDDLPLNMNLLFEIEAESWSNGSRGRHREGSAPSMRPLGLEISFLELCDCQSYIAPTEITTPWYKLNADIPKSVEVDTVDLTSGFSSTSFSSLGVMKGNREQDSDMKICIMVGGKVECPAFPSARLSSEYGNRSSTSLTRASSTATTGRGDTAPSITTARKRETGGLNGVVPAGQDRILPRGSSLMSTTIASSRLPLGSIKDFMGNVLSETARDTTIQSQQHQQGTGTLRSSAQGLSSTTAAALRATNNTKTNNNNNASTLVVSDQGAIGEIVSGLELSATDSDVSGKTIPVKASVSRDIARDQAIDDLIKTFKESRNIETILKKTAKQRKKAIPFMPPRPKPQALFGPFYAGAAPLPSNKKQQAAAAAQQELMASQCPVLPVSTSSMSINPTCHASSFGSLIKQKALEKEASGTSRRIDGQTSRKKSKGGEWWRSQLAPSAS